MIQPFESRFFKPLERIIALHPEGISEYDLLQRLLLEEPGLLDPDGPDSDLALFQNHFILFHHLYLLKDRLRQMRGMDLEIHCLLIRLQPFEPKTHCLEREDPLRLYYLDWQNFEKVTGQDVSAMLKDFWNGFEAYQNQSEALEVLGLEKGADKAQIKARYRRLAKEHHPDRGGDAQRFDRIACAAESLLIHARTRQRDEF